MGPGRIETLVNIGMFKSCSCRSTSLVGVMLLFVVLCSYLIYLSFPLIGVIWAESLAIYLPGASGSKAQMIAAHGVVRVIIPDTSKIIWHLRNMLSAPSGALQFQMYFRLVSMEITCLGLHPLKSLAQAWSHREG